MHRSTSANAGFTLIEMVICLAIAVVIFLAIGAMTQTGSFAMEHLTKAQQVDHEIKRAMDRITEVIKEAPRSALTVDNSGVDHDVLTLQISNPQTPTVVDLGYFDAAGTFQSDFEAEFRVINGVLTLRSVDDAGDVVNSMPLCREIDVLDAGAKGFQVTSTPPLVSFVVRVRTEFTPGKVLTRSEQTQVFQQNE